MGTLELLGTAFVVGLSGAMAPGGLLLATMTEVIRKGFWAGPAAVLGHASLELGIVFLLTRGLGQSLSQKSLLGVIGIIGGLVLAFFGYLTIKSSSNIHIPQKSGPQWTGQDVNLGSKKPASVESHTPDPGLGNKGYMGFFQTVLTGMAASISNPYWLLWWATVGAAYVASGLTYGDSGPYVFYAGHIASDFAWYSIVSFGVITGKRFLNDRVYRAILVTFSLFMIVIGVYFVKQGVSLVLM